jgi:hypothetical protein
MIAMNGLLETMPLGPFTLVATFLTVWWIVLFAILPLGMSDQIKDPPTDGDPVGRAEEPEPQEEVHHHDLGVDHRLARHRRHRLDRLDPRARYHPRERALAFAPFARFKPRALTEFAENSSHAPVALLLPIIKKPPPTPRSCRIS